MDTVPTTPTALDRTEEVRKLNIIIATISSQKDIAQREVNMLIGSVDDLTRRKTALEEEIDSMERLIIATVKLAKEITNECIVAIRGAIGDVDNVKSVLRVLASKVESGHKELEKAKEIQKISHEQVMAEVVELNRKKADLDVYKRRIEKFYEEHMPDQKVVI